MTYFTSFRSISQHSSKFSAATTLKFGMDFCDDQHLFLDKIDLSLDYTVQSVVIRKNWNFNWLRL